jgi:hypothetical protein
LLDKDGWIGVGALADLECLMSVLVFSSFLVCSFVVAVAVAAAAFTIDVLAFERVLPCE